MKVLVVICALAACKSHPTARADRISATTGELKLDGELGESDWSVRALRHVLAADGAQARPYSEASFLHDKDYVYVGLYAADENIQSGEFFDVHIGTLSFHANATGTVTPMIEGVKTSIDRDGTLDDPSSLRSHFEQRAPRLPQLYPSRLRAAIRRKTISDAAVRGRGLPRWSDKARLSPQRSHRRSRPP
jgi:hypothetical protein